jgi:ribosomal protein S18 acetylase RimI-like enzyme
MFNVIIRVAEPEDAASVACFSRKTFYENYSEHNSKRDIQTYFANEFSVAKLMAEVDRRQNIVLLAYNSYTLVGYAVIRETPNPPELKSAIRSIELSRFYVDKPFKNGGVGNALMKECIYYARSRNKENLWLGVWHENYEAIDFFSKWGFSIIGSKIFLLGDNPHIDWVMNKNLLE